MHIEILPVSIDVEQVTGMQHLLVVHWHHEPLDNPYQGFLELVCREHQFNFLLWHEEDVARCPHSSDVRIATAKRTIDKLNQQRNDAIEHMDDAIADIVEREETLSRGPLNTETPGSVIDRLSILALRMYHFEEQLQRADVDEEHCQIVQQKLDICTRQHWELARSLRELLTDILAGRKRHRTYRQMKMYNDSTLNPYLYRNRSDAP
jgi:hypothetical protein